jgi:hypothetical protein
VSDRPDMFRCSIVEDEARLVHWCRMGLLAVGILHWIVFYLLTQSGPTEVSGTVTRARTRYAFHAADLPGSCPLETLSFPRP